MFQLLTMVRARAQRVPRHAVCMPLRRILWRAVRRDDLRAPCCAGPGSVRRGLACAGCPETDLEPGRAGWRWQLWANLDYPGMPSDPRKLNYLEPSTHGGGAKGPHTANTAFPKPVLCPYARRERPIMRTMTQTRRGEAGVWARAFVLCAPHPSRPSRAVFLLLLPKINWVIDAVQGETNTIETWAESMNVSACSRLHVLTHTHTHTSHSPAAKSDARVLGVRVCICRRQV